MSTAISIRQLSKLLKEAKVSRRKREEVIATAKGKERLPEINQRQLRRLKMDLLLFRKAGLSFRPSNKRVHRINPSRIRLIDGRIKTLKKIHQKRQEQK